MLTAPIEQIRTAFYKNKPIAYSKKYILETDSNYLVFKDGMWRGHFYYPLNIMWAPFFFWGRLQDNNTFKLCF